MNATPEMIDQNQMEEMALHQIINLPQVEGMQCSVMRVVGGWLYLFRRHEQGRGQYGTTSQFVPEPDRLVVSGIGIDTYLEC